MTLREQALTWCLFAAVAMSMGVVNTWLISGFDWAEVEKAPLYSFIFTAMLPFAWFGGFGIFVFPALGRQECRSAEELHGTRRPASAPRRAIQIEPGGSEDLT